MLLDVMLGHIKGGKRSEMVYLGFCSFNGVCELFISMVKKKKIKHQANLLHKIGSF